MPRPDRARAEPVARRRAALYPQRHVIEGVVYSPGYQECDIDQDGGRTTMPLLFTLAKLLGRRVRVTIELLPEGGRRCPLTPRARRS